MGSSCYGAVGAVLSLTRFTVVSPLVIVTVTTVFEPSSLFSSVSGCAPAGSASFEQGVVVQRTRPCTLALAGGVVMIVKKPGPVASPSDAAGLALAVAPALAVGGGALAAGAPLGAALGGGVAAGAALGGDVALPASSRSIAGARACTAGAALASTPPVAGSGVAPTKSTAGITADAPTTSSAAAAMPYGALSLVTSAS